MEESNTTSEAKKRRAAQDEMLIVALAAGRSYEDAGAAASVSGRTVARRMGESAFASEVSDRRGEHVQRVTGQLTQLAEEAVAAIAACLQDQDAKIRLTAGKLILELAVRFRHQTDLERAVTEVREFQLGKH